MSLVSKLLSPKVLLPILILSVVLNAFLGFGVIDAAISLDHARSQVRHLEERAANGVEIVRYLVIGAPVGDVRKMADGFSEQGELVKTRTGEIHISDMIFKYSSDKIESVHYLGEPNQAGSPTSEAEKKTDG